VTLGAVLRDEEEEEEEEEEFIRRRGSPVECRASVAAADKQISTEALDC
jgi:hypothetical protein